MPRTSAGIFVGWQLESGLRYRMILKIADLESIRQGDFKWRFVHSVHEKEVHFPEVTCFPFAEARDIAIRSLKSPDAALPLLPEVPLPFAIEAGEAERKEFYRVEVP